MHCVQDVWHCCWLECQYCGVAVLAMGCWVEVVGVRSACDLCGLRGLCGKEWLMPSGGERADMLQGRYIHEENVLFEQRMENGYVLCLPHDNTLCQQYQDSGR